LWFYRLFLKNNNSDFKAVTLQSDKNIEVELMAPAGDRQSLKAAVANGADAVYLGLPDFNARKRADNFTLDELPGVIGYLHNHNVDG